MRKKTQVDPNLLPGTALILAVLVLALHPAAAARTSSSCIACHSAMDIEELRQPAIGYQDDLHFAAGFGCEHCHGGDPTRGYREDDPDLAHSKSHGFIGAPAKQDIPEVCAKCHADVEIMKQYNPKLPVDQLLEYRSSQHGKLLSQGDNNVATCVSCHGVHGIYPVKDARSSVYKPNVARTCATCHANAVLMANYNLPTNQFELYKTSVHGKKLMEEGDLAAPTCNNCHGSHGATPPGLTSVSNACGGCHANNLDYFNQSPHNEAFAAMEIGKCETCHANNLDYFNQSPHNEAFAAMEIGKCETCHGHHDVQTPVRSQFGIGDESVCITCHSEGDAGYVAARTMGAGYDSLSFMLQEARELLERAERGGVDVSLGKFDLHSADDALIKARTAVHYFDTSKYDEVIRAGLADADKVFGQGREALDDLEMRRIGLSFSIPVILLVALTLYLRVRRMERDKPYA